jgi:hypothetical protein
MATSTSIDLAARMERLERANRRLVGGVVVLALGSACIVAIGAAAPAPKSIEVESVTFRDGEGHHRGMIGVDTDGTFGLGFNDANGRRRISLGVISGKDASLQILDLDGRPGVLLGVKPKDSASLRLDGGRGQVAIGSPVDGGGAMIITAKNEKILAGIVADEDGKAKAYP